MRHVVVVRDRDSVRFSEVFEPLEVTLQKTLLDNPELLPIDEFDLGGSLLIIGRETVLASGRPDLLGVSEDGGIVIIEMKIGPENSDFRRALAQLIDYGSDLWGMGIEDLEQKVLLPFLRGPHGPEDGAWTGVKDLRSAFGLRWPERENEVTDAGDRQARVRAALESGAFSYVLVAQSLSTSMERSIRYLNEAMTSSRFFGVELTKFARQDSSDNAYSARTLVKPDAVRKQAAVQAKSRDELMARFGAAHREAVEAVLRQADHLGLKVYLGTTGASLKIGLVDSEPPVSIAWLYPPESHGTKGAKQLTLGYHSATIEKLRMSGDRLRAWHDRVLRKLPNAKPVGGDATVGVTLTWDRAASDLTPVLEALELLVNGWEEARVDGAGPAEPTDRSVTG